MSFGQVVDSAFSERVCAVGGLIKCDNLSMVALGVDSGPSTVGTLNNHSLKLYSSQCFQRCCVMAVMQDVCTLYVGTLLALLVRCVLPGEIAACVHHSSVGRRDLPVGRFGSKAKRYFLKHCYDD